ANELEPDRRFVDLASAPFGHAIQQMSGRHASSDVARPLRTSFAQVIQDERQNVIGRNERSVAINEAEPVGVAVARSSQCESLVEHEMAHPSQILLRRFGTVAAEEHVTIIMNQVHFALMPPQNLIQVAAAGPPQRVICELQPGRSDLREIYTRGEVAQ